MKLKLALLTGLMFSAVGAANHFESGEYNEDDAVVEAAQVQAPTAVAPMTDEERMAAALARSLATNFAEEAHRAKMALTRTTPISNVTLKAILQDAHNVKDSEDPVKLQEAIERVTAAQRTKELTPDQHTRVEKMLCDLVGAISLLTTHQHLGAR